MKLALCSQNAHDKAVLVRRAQWSYFTTPCAIVPLPVVGEKREEEEDKREEGGGDGLDE